MNLIEIAVLLVRNNQLLVEKFTPMWLLKKVFCNTDYIHRLEHFHCNACKYRGSCLHEKKDFTILRWSTTTCRYCACVSKDSKSSSRKFTRLTAKEIEIIDDVLLEQIRRLKQSLHHAFISNPILLEFVAKRRLED